MSKAAPKDDGRILKGAAAPEEAQFERQLRPRSFAEYVGQEQAVASLRVSVEAARQRAECVDHALLYGLATVLMAVMTGWFASIVFRRD